MLLKSLKKLKQSYTVIVKKIIKNFNNYRWEQKEKIHLTLKFIGDFEESKIPLLIEDLYFLESIKPFQSELTNLGFFYRDMEPKILWAGLKIEERVLELVDNLNSKLEKFGIKPEKRKFNPHLTLMRIKKHPDESFINEINNSSLEGIEFIANKISLMKSTLTKHGSTYNELNVFELN